MATKKTWSIVRGDLSVRSGDEFARYVLHYLRIIFPDLIETPRLLDFDNDGVDLCVCGTGSHLSLAVQAKGFKVEKVSSVQTLAASSQQGNTEGSITKSQVIRQIIPSIRKFRASGLICDKYILLHNKVGSDRTLAKQVEAELQLLITHGVAKEAELWDIDTFIKEAKRGVLTLVKNRLREKSSGLQKQQRSFFHFGGEILDTIPFRRFSLPGDENIEPVTIGTFNTLFNSPRKVRYSMLIGSFGIGKTTSCLNAANDKELGVVYARAQNIVRTGGTIGENYLLGKIGDDLDLFCDLPEETAVILLRDLGPTLARILRNNEQQFLLVIDGLDEHPFYSTPDGLHTLTNELASLRCSIVLTTRREHFDLLASDFGRVLQCISTANGPSREVEVVELTKWQPEHALALVDMAIRSSSGELFEQDLLALRKRLANAEESIQILLEHPLFLQMSLDLIVAGSKVMDDQSDLMRSWVVQKLRRDLNAPRLKTKRVLPEDAYIEGMIEAMVLIAQKMKEGGCEIIDAEEALRLARDKISYAELDQVEMVTTSLLVPAHTRRGKTMQFRFFHAKFKEFLESESVPLASLWGFSP